MNKQYLALRSLLESVHSLGFISWIYNEHYVKSAVADMTILLNTRYN